MKFKYDDGGRAAAGFKGSAGDCVTRAVAIALGLDYAYVYKELANGNAGHRNKTGQFGKRSARNGIDTNAPWFRSWMMRRGWTWTPTMKIGSGCTVHLNERELPAGRIIARVSKHVCAVIDGVLHDTYDSSDRGVTVYPPSYPADELPKGARWLENGNGWAYSPERCVYGYWSKQP